MLGSSAISFQQHNSLLLWNQINLHCVNMSHFSQYMAPMHWLLWIVLPGSLCYTQNSFQWILRGGKAGSYGACFFSVSWGILCYKSVCLSLHIQHLIHLFFFDSWHFTGVRWDPNTVLICIFLKAEDTKHLYLMTICVSSFKLCSFSTFIEWMTCFLLFILNYLYILYISLHPGVLLAEFLKTQSYLWTKMSSLYRTMPFLCASFQIELYTFISFYFNLFG